MIKYIIENKKRIRKFNYEYFLAHKEYRMASALAALDTTNQIAQSYFQDETNLSRDDQILRIYALLQGLFVSIDSLYSLAYALTGTKGFININNNQSLRKLKYVRNNVVGHPSEVIDGKSVSYCILDTENLTKKGFSYTIYTADSTKVQNVDVNEIVQAYYKEANDLLEELYRLSLTYSKNNNLKDSIQIVLDNYYKNGHYMNQLNDFIDKYNQEYPRAKKEQHRILWRYELVLKLTDIRTANQDTNDLIKYCVGIELNKIYSIIMGKTYNHREDFPLPNMVLSLYRFLNRNPEYVPYIKDLKESDYPLFYDSLTKMYEGASLKKMQGAMDYLGFIISLFKGQQWDLVYAIALPIGEYRIK